MKIKSFKKDPIMENPFNMKAVRLVDLPEGEIIHLILGKGEKMVPHIPPVSLAIYVIEGEIRIKLDGDERLIEADDCLEVPGGSRLGGVNESTEEARVIICRIPRPTEAPVILEEGQL